LTVPEVLIFQASKVSTKSPHPDSSPPLPSPSGEGRGARGERARGVSHAQGGAPSAVLRSGPFEGPRNPKASGFAGGYLLFSSVHRQVVAVAEGYDLWAQTYDSDPNPLLSAEERVLEPLLAPVANKVVLDVACGTGRWLEKLLRAGAKSGSGVDISLAMLAGAQGKTGLKGRLVSGDCTSLPYRSQSSDLVISSFALGHINDLRTLAQELARVAVPGADLWVSDLHPEARARGWATGFRNQGRNTEIYSFCHSIEQVHKSFSACGFDTLEHHNVRLGEPERPIFERAGKASLFQDACEMPAVCIWHFTRTASTL
jgi:ubiquinone/menaquinone biosynthesis C-methylase UbiE